MSRVAERVAAQLRTRILGAGDTDEIQLPTQVQLQREFGVSYPALREALAILEAEGLVTVRRGSVGGAQVHRPGASNAAYHLALSLQGVQVTLRDLASGLQLLEPLCAAECARRPDRAVAVVPILNANLDETASLVGDGVAFTRCARAFHDLVVGLTPNLTVRSVVKSLVELWSAQEQTWAEATTRHGDYPSAARADEVVRTHRHLVAEIAAGRAEEAERLARAHLTATQSVLLDHVDDYVVDAWSARDRARE